MQLKAKGESREGSTSLEKGGQGALIGRSAGAEHANEVKKSTWGGGVCRDEGGP